MLLLLISGSKLAPVNVTRSGWRRRRRQNTTEGGALVVPWLP